MIGAAVTDSSFIAPVVAVHIISFLVGVTWGYIIDGARVTPQNPLGVFGSNFEGSKNSEILVIEEIKDSQIVFDDLGRENEDGFGYFLLHQGYAIWWLVTSIGLVFAIMLILWSSQDPEYALVLEYNPMKLDGFITWIGLIGTTLSVILYISQKSWIRAVSYTHLTLPTIYSV